MKVFLIYCCFELMFCHVEMGVSSSASTGRWPRLWPLSSTSTNSLASNFPWRLLVWWVDEIWRGDEKNMAVVLLWHGVLPLNPTNQIKQMDQLYYSSLYTHISYVHIYAIKYHETNCILCHKKKCSCLMGSRIFLLWRVTILWRLSTRPKKAMGSVESGSQLSYGPRAAIWS